MYSARKDSECPLCVGLVQHYSQKRAFYRGFTLDPVSHDGNRKNHTKTFSYR